MKAMDGSQAAAVALSDAQAVADLEEARGRTLALVAPF
jgi:hypothetical protein